MSEYSTTGNHEGHPYLDKATERKCPECGNAQHGPAGCIRTLWQWIRRDRFKDFTHKVTSYGVEPTTENYSRLMAAHRLYLDAVVEQSVQRGRPVDRAYDGE